MEMVIGNVVSNSESLVLLTELYAGRVLEDRQMA